MNEERKESSTVPAAIIIAGVIIAVAVIFTRGGGGNTQVKTVFESPTNSQESKFEMMQRLSANILPVSTDDHIMGNPNAKYILVEYSDIECPYCAAFHESMKTLMDEYGKDGTLAWVYRHFPLDIHKTAALQAVASECIAKLGSEQAFWDFLDLSFTNKPQELIKGASTLEELALQVKISLSKYATSLGVNESDFNNCVDKKMYLDDVLTDIRNGSESGVTGTPHNILIGPDGSRTVISGNNGPLVKQLIEKDNS